MLEIRQSDEFNHWLTNLRDRRAVRRVAVRITRMQAGHMGDVKYFEGIGELRIDYGPGYRVYFVRRGMTIIILLSGGDKSTQGRDITRAKAMAQEG